jgi:hypothetical protein
MHSSFQQFKSHNKIQITSTHCLFATNCTLIILCLKNGIGQSDANLILRVGNLIVGLVIHGKIVAKIANIPSQ